MRISNRKAQIAWEFIMLLGLGILMLLLFLSPLSEYLGGSIEDSYTEIFNDFARAIQQELIQAASVQPGYARIIEIPPPHLVASISSVPYSINNTATSLIVHHSEGDIVLGIPRTLGNLTNGSNLVRNIGGIVYVN